MSTACADLQAVPKNLDAPRSSSPENESNEFSKERPQNEFPNTDTLLQPCHISNRSNDYSPNPHHDNENIQPMLDTNGQLSVIQAWMSTIHQATSLRDSILATRMDTRRERTRCYQQEEFFERLMDAFINMLNSAMEQGSYLKCKNDLDDLSKKLKAERESLKLLRERSTMLENELSKREYRLTRLEEDIYNQVNTEYHSVQVEVPADPLQGFPTTQMQLGPNSLGAEHNPRDELYSRLGDLRILIDRLNDFETDLRQILDERDILRATGKVDLSDDITFFEEIRIKRAKLQSDFEDTQADVQRLKQVCNREGIEFEDVHLPSTTAINDDTYLDGTSLAPSNQEAKAGLPLPGSPSIITAFLDTHERINSWLEDPSSSETFTGAAEQSMQERPRGESFSNAGWVPIHSQPNGKRHSSAYSPGGNRAQHGMPGWISDPPPLSENIEALLRESTAEPTKQIRKRGSHATL